MIELWYAKYRPTRLDEYVWKSQDLKEKVEGWIGERNPPNLILLGPSGTGKTALIQLIISGMEVDEADVLKLNASVENNVETIRSTIMGFCESGGWSGMKIVFLDEADNISFAAQQMLRGIMDSYHEEVRFFFTANFAHRIIDPLKGRSTVILCDALDMETFILRLAAILEAEHVEVNEEILGEIVEATYPDLRKAIGCLQDNIKDGVLYKSGITVKSELGWEQAVLDCFREKKRVKEIRDCISTIRKEEIENVYELLYSNSDLFGVNEEKAIISIADGLYRHYFCGFPDINLIATILKLTLLTPERQD